MYKLPNKMLFIDIVHLLKKYLSFCEWRRIEDEDDGISFKDLPVNASYDDEFDKYSKFYERQYIAETGGWWLTC